MRRIIALFLALTLCALPHVYAEKMEQKMSYKDIISGVQNGNFTKSELWEIVNTTRKELDKFDPTFTEDNIIYEDKYVKVAFLSFELSYDTLDVKCLVENKSDIEIQLQLQYATCNGWDLDFTDGVRLFAPLGKSQKSFHFRDVSDYCGIKDTKEIEEFKFILVVRDWNKYERINKNRNEYIYLPI